MMEDPRSFRALFPVEGRLVSLDVFAAKDITDAYLGWLNDPLVVQYSDQRFRKHTRRTSLEYLEACDSSGDLFLTVRTKSDRKYVGTMSAHISPMHETADIGIMIGERSCWGTGVGRDAWSTLMSLLIDVAQLRKVTGGTMGCNKAMVKIMANSGMKPDGVRIAQNLVDHKPEDIVHFARFRDG